MLKQTLCVLIAGSVASMSQAEYLRLTVSMVDRDEVDTTAVTAVWIFDLDEPARTYDGTRYWSPLQTELIIHSLGPSSDSSPFTSASLDGLPSPVSMPSDSGFVVILDEVTNGSWPRMEFQMRNDDVLFMFRIEDPVQYIGSEEYLPTAEDSYAVSTDPDGAGRINCWVHDLQSGGVTVEANWRAGLGLESHGDHLSYGIEVLDSLDPAACGQADLAEPMGVLDLADITAFVAGFTAGCP